MIDIINIVNIALTIVGGVSVVLGIVAPLTKNVKDDKILFWIKKVLSMVSVNVNDKTMKLDSNRASLEVIVK